MKGLTLTGLLIALTAVILYNFENKIPVKYTDKLEVNLKNYAFRAHTRKNEEAGVKDIAEIIKLSLYEEEWAYLPKKEKWVEIGYGEWRTRRKAGVYFHTKVLSNLASSNNSIVLYHLHTKKGFGILSALPSDTDIGSMLRTSKKFYSWKPNGSLKFKTQSVKGVTEYSLTDMGKSYVSVNDFEEFEVTKKRYSENKRNFNVCKIVSNTNEAINEACDYLSTQYFKLKFTPLKEVLARLD